MNDDVLRFYQKIRDFLNIYLPKQRGSSPNTVKSYREALNTYIDYVVMRGIPMKQITFDIMTRDSVDGFLDWLEEEKGYAVSSRNQRLAAIKSFLKYSAERDKTVMAIQIEVSAIRKKVEHVIRDIEFFSEEALKVILEQPDQSKKKGQRDLVFLIILYDTGARIQEILDLKVKDICLDKKSPFVTVTGKGGKMRNIPIMDKTREHLVTYLRRFHPVDNGDDYLFYTVRKGIHSQMSADNAEKFIEKYGKSARKKLADVPVHLYPHMFRHSRAMHLYRNGMPLPLVSEWLGHATIEVTRQYYANADTTMKQKAIEKATSELNPLVSGEIDFDWEDDEELLKKLYGLK